MKIEYKIALVALLMIFGLELFALSRHIDGTLFSVAIGGIGAIVGYIFKSGRNA